VTSDITLYAKWETDSNKDGTPDKYQVFVNFESANENQGTVTTKTNAAPNTGINQVYTLQDTEGNYLTSGSVTPSLDNVTVEAGSDYAFDIWTKDSDTNAVNPTATLSNVAGNTTIVFKANFADDTKSATTNSTTTGDGIPDKYQIVVNYEVKDGKWSDETTANKQKVLTLQNTSGEYSENGYATLSTPNVGDQPDNGYTAGDWTNLPTGNNVKKDDNNTTFTYKYVKGSYGYTVYFYKDEVDSSETADTGNCVAVLSDKAATFGEKIAELTDVKNAITSNTPTGYENGAVVTSDANRTIGTNASENVIHVVYSKQSVPYSIVAHYIDRNGTEVGHDYLNPTAATNPYPKAAYGTAIISLLPKDYTDARSYTKNNVSKSYVFDKVQIKDGAVVTNDTALTVENTQIDLYYAVDELGKVENGTETGDGVADKYQVFVKYEAGEHGTISGTTYQVIDLRETGTDKLKTSVTLTFPTTTANTGYSFSGWTSPEGVTVDNNTMSGFTAGQTYTFTANWKWTPQSYTISYDLDGGSLAEGETNPTTYNANTATFTLNNPSKAGYTFAGWTGSNGTTAQTEVTIQKGSTGNKTYTANWMAEPEQPGDTNDAPIYVPTYTPSYEPTYTPAETPERPTEVAAAGVPDDLNGDDHFAYIIGFDDGTVKPTANITRAEVATIFFRLLKEDVREKYLTDQNSFADSSVGDWYNTAVSTMAALGVVKGRSADNFDPTAYITRAELAAICSRFDDTMIDTNPSTFSDISDHWAETEILRAAALGWVEGYTDGTFGPDLPITRAEAVTMINRVLNRVPESVDDLLPDMKTWSDNLDPSAWYYLALQEATNSHDFQTEPTSSGPP
jgi:uncharacterized repeat protein (TIGR02543 family)